MDQPNRVFIFHRGRDKVLDFSAGTTVHSSMENLFSYHQPLVFDRLAGVEGKMRGQIVEDLDARLLRALEDGRPVNILGRVYRIGENQNFLRTAIEISEQIIALKNQRLVLISDDERGLVIGEKEG